VNPSESKPTRNTNFLLGFLVKGEVDAIFKQQPLELLDEEADLFSTWRKAWEATRALKPTEPTPLIQLIDERTSPIITEIKARPTFARYYEAVDDYQFVLLPIDSLLTPQSFADMDYIRDLARRIDTTSSLADLLRFAMAEGTVTEPILCGNQVIFNSSRPDLHAEQIPSVRQVGDGEFEIVVRAVSRPNYVQAAAINGRLLLTNGVHKVCALYLTGHRSVPCLLRRVGRIEETGLNVQSSLFRPELVGGPRPAQVIDFLNPQVATPVRVRSMSHVVRVATMVETIRIPTISDALAGMSKRTVEPIAPGVVAEGNHSEPSAAVT
jgi:hypothetical protein